MSLSMSPKAHYVVQTSVYETPFLGRLTDRRIAEYVRQGRLSYPGNPNILALKAFGSKNEPNSKAKRKSSVAKKPTLEQRKQDIKRLLGDLL